MGRRRKRDLLLPNGVYRHGRRFRLRIYIAPDRRPAWHYFAATTYDKFWPEWSRYLKKNDVVSMADLFARYESREIPKKAPDTRESDYKALDMLRLMFGAMKPADIQPWHVVRYVETRGEHAPVRANRERALLSHIFTKARHWGMLQHNPCHKLQYKNAEAPRTRYVTDDEVNKACELAPPRVAAAIRLGVLTGLRKRDILTLTLDMWDPEKGLTVTLSKTRRAGSAPKRLLFEPVPALGGVIDSARACVPRGNSDTILMFSEAAFASAWARLMRRIVADGGERWQFRDLRGKHATDVMEKGGDAQRNLAHSSGNTTRRHYTRLPVRVLPNS